MATARLSDETLDAAIAAVAEHGTLRAAARASNLPYQTFESRFREAPRLGRDDPRAIAREAARRGEAGGPPIPPEARPPEGFAVTRNSATFDADGNLLRQSVQSRRDAGDTWALPDGHEVRGESALLDPEGRTLARWVKTATAPASSAALVEGLRAAFADYAGAAPPIAAPEMAEDDLLVVYPIPDLHLGLLSWAPETGDSYDIKIATDIAINSIGQLVAQSRPSRHAVVLGLGDYLHSNDSAAVTPASKHRLDVDGRFPKLFAAGARLATAIVDMVARKHASVETVWLAGNHDVDAAVAISVALSMFYENNPRITVTEAPGLFWYRRFGRVLLGGTHGHTVKPREMAMAMAADRPEDWGASDHRVMMFGHLHHENVRDVGPVRVEGFTTPAARDAWAHGGGYRSGRSLSAITYHKELGEIGRHKVAIAATRARVRVAAGSAAA